ncbi:MAG: hypothetical protein ABR551_06810 [Gemmatimonadales bacterium]
MTPTPTRPSLRHDERGIALAIAIFALVIIATLVTGVFFMARLEQRSGNSALWSTQAAEAADAGLNATLANWPSAVNTLAAGTTQALATQTMGGNIRYTASVYKVSDQIFLVQSRGERTDAGGGVLAGTSVGRVVRLVIPNIEINAALTANGPVTQGGSSEIDGNDNIPDDWAACTPTTAVAGLRTSYTHTVNGAATTLEGDPPKVENDTSVTSAKITDAFWEFAALADHVYTGNWPPSQGILPVLDGDGNCTTTFDNWGEPWRSPKTGTVTACIDRAPIVHVTGDFKVTAGGGGRRGQGVLLVEGDFSIAGNFEFTGILIVLGSVDMKGTGNKITGAVLTNSTSGASVGEESTIAGNPNVLYSSCAISAVLASGARARPLAERSWVQLY